MTLRLRLLVTIGASFALFWTLSSFWMLVDLRAEFRDTLDERLAASARMVAALVVDSPLLAAQAVPRETIPFLTRNDGVACEIRLARGLVVGRTRNSPQQLGAAGPGYRTRSIDGVVWRSYTLDQNGVRITTADRVQRREQLLHDIVFAAFVPFAIAMVATLAALWFAIRRGLLPLEAIRTALAARAPDALRPLPEQGLPGELRPLVATVNALLGRIERTIGRERRFTGDAAHELRTPLTAVKTHIQVARLAGCGPEVDGSLAQAEQGVLRLQHTIDQLLLLARVEGPFSFGDGDCIDAGAIAHETLSQLPSGQACRTRIVDEGGSSAIPAAPALLATTALRNILDNALRHGGEEKQVTLRLRRDQASVSFIVEDEGAGMDAQDIGRAAERFWRKGRGVGSGLGLSIARHYARAHGGELVYEPDGSGARFTLTIPQP